MAIEEDTMIKMKTGEKREKIANMRALMRHYDRIGDVVLREQMRRSIAEANATWITK